MKNGWTHKTLGEVAEFKNGLNYNRNSNGQTLPVVGVGDFQSNDVVPIGDLQSATIDGTLDDEYAIRRNDILTVRSNGSKELVGRCMLVPDIDETTSYSGFVIRIRFDTDEIAPRFLLHFMKSSSTRERLTSEGGGANISNINQRKLSSLPVPVPPLPEQRRIVGILDEAFAGIATAKANAEKNLQNARALFESHLNAVFTQRGDGWVEKPLGQVADLLDCLHKTPTYTETGFPMVRVTDIKPGYLDLSKTRKVDEQTFILFSKTYAPKVGDIVFSRVGSCGVSALVNSDDPFCLGQNTVFILPKMNSTLLYHFLNSPNAKAQFEGFIDGTTQPTISMKSIRQVAVPIAPSVEHHRLVAMLDSMREETHRLESIYHRKLAALDELKKSLLHQAFSGKL